MFDISSTVILLFSGFAISKISNKRVEKVEDVLAVGDEVRVKVYEIDSQDRINLTMKDLELDNKEE